MNSHSVSNLVTKTNFRPFLDCARLVILLFCLRFQPDAAATPILYTFSGIGSGSLGASSFNNAPFSINVLSDTVNVISTGVTGGRPMWSADSLLTTFTISGVGSGTFSLGTRVFDSQGIQTLGLAATFDLGGFDMWDFNSGDFFTYDLQHAVGPLNNINPSLFSASMADQPTTLGGLTFSPTPTITFQATLVPEPGCLVVVGFGGLAAIFSRRRKLVVS